MSRPLRAFFFMSLSFLAGVTVNPAALSTEAVPFWWETALIEARDNNYALLTPDEFAARLHGDDNCLLVDVRPDYEFESGHIPGAVNLVFDPGDRMSLAPEKQKRFEALLGPDKNRCIIILCRDFR